MYSMNLEFFRLRELFLEKFILLKFRSYSLFYFSQEFGYITIKLWKELRIPPPTQFFLQVELKYLKTLALLASLQSSLAVLLLLFTPILIKEKQKNWYPMLITKTLPSPTTAQHKKKNKLVLHGQWLPLRKHFRFFFRMKTLQEPLS